MTRRGHDGAAANSRMRSVVEYTVDRRGWGMFSRLAGRAQMGIAGTETRRVIDRTAPSNSWNGRIHASPQRFVGLANLSSAAIPRTDRVAELSDAKSAGLETGAQRLFRERMARRR
jgi:hypothetical protein